MPVYRVTIKGRRKPILTKAETAAKARDSVVDAVALTAEEMADALGDGEKLWNGSDDLPADDPVPEQNELQEIADERAVKPKSKDAGEPPAISMRRIADAMERVEISGSPSPTCSRCGEYLCDCLI